VRALFRHEFRLLVRDHAFVAATLLFTALTVFAVANGARWLEQRRASIAGERAQNEKLYAATTPPSRLEHRAVFDPAPAAALAVGRGDLDPFTSRVTMLTGRHKLFSQWQLANPLTLLAGRFDLAFLVVYLFPLLIVALTYNVLSSEREQGTLVMVLSQPVRLRTLLAAKIGVRGLAVLAAAGIVTAAASFFVIDFGAPGAWTALAAWLAATALYGAFWFGLSLWVNAAGRSSAANAVALITLWVALVVVAPVLLNLGVAAMHPLPSRLALLQSTRAIENETSRAATKLLDRFYSDHPELVPDADRMHYLRSGYAVRQEQERRLLPEVVAYERQLRAQQGAIDRWRFASPAVLTSEVLAGIAGNDRTRFLAWQDAVRAFVVQWRERLLADFYLGQPMTPAKTRALPRFRFQEPPQGRAQLGASLAGLLAMSLLAAGAGFVALRRYPIAG
jgi:ABC-2 type transport system permease protein